MKYLDAIPGLEAAKKANAFVRLGSEAEDFAINFNLGWILCDAICTYACLNAQPELTRAQISRAWLTDDKDSAMPLMDIFELSEEAAQATGFPKHRTVLMFGPISAEARQMRLEIERLEPPGEGLGYFHPIVDPLAHMSDDNALHIMAWEEPDDPMAPIPIGTIAGCWAFEVDAPRHNGAWEMGGNFRVNKDIRLGDNLMRVNSLKRGLTGWCMTSEFITPANSQVNPREVYDLLWQVSSPDELLEHLAGQELLQPFAPPAVDCSLAATGSAQRCSEIYGPLAPLGNKFYHFFPPLADETALPDHLLIHKVPEMPIDEPWGYVFDPKNIVTPPTRLDFELAPFHIKLALSIEGLFWEDNMMLLRPLVQADPEMQCAIDVADCLIFDHNGQSYACLGQCLVDMPVPKNTLKREQVYGWQYPPIHKHSRHASFQVFTITVTPFEALSYEIAPFPAPQETEDEAAESSEEFVQ